ncbi:MAG: hypothetical protein AAFR62_07500 [Cyanobacteria bacterium J06629_2]
MARSHHLGIFPATFVRRRSLYLKIYICQHQQKRFATYIPQAIASGEL